MVERCGHHGCRPELNLIHVGTGNGSPWNPNLRNPAGGENLYRKRPARHCDACRDVPGVNSGRNVPNLGYCARETL